ncbi:MAG: type II secretion system minor pseudopilin GspJ [Gammaproteobacteria bacterium]|nr:type II secretion system minor pseudopilin GspJ [Gammaproteobacteria bacterium]
MNIAKNRGFTLIEVLVASFITAMILVMAYTTITQAAQDRQRIEQRFDRFQSVQLAVRLITQDIAQAQPRPVRDLIGQGSLPALMTADSDNGIEITVGGYNNPLNLQRSRQQRIGYEIEDDILYRNQWLVLDRTQGSVPIRRKLLDGVYSIGVRFMDTQLEWQDSWPRPESESPRTLPKAVEVTIEFEDIGVIRRVIEVAG